MWNDQNFLDGVNGSFRIIVLGDSNMLIDDRKSEHVSLGLREKT